MASSVAVEDMILLPKLTDQGILDNLEVRHARDVIYTYVGAIVVSVNPFKLLPIYGEQQMRQYSTTSAIDMPPHIFALADSAYKTMLAEEENQCVIVSGESGAGKTEAAKQILNYWTFISNNSDSAQKIKAKLIDSNPILESFGNAKTLRNNNSSRFGKYLSVQFVFPSGLPFRGNIDTFLLEKSRVVFQAKNERDFHIFYQFLAGGSQYFSSLGMVGQPGKYHYLAQSQCYTVDDVDDARDFDETVHAMNTCGIDSSRQNAIFTLISAVLQLGNVNFIEDNASKVTIGDKGALQQAARLIGIDAGLLDNVLRVRKIKGIKGGENIDASNNELQAIVVRDAIAKAIYSRMFDSIVKSINESIYADDSAGDCPTLLASSCLDIYGFEIFSVNGFEQFCINYVNEKLQQIFIRLILLDEQAEYVAEGIQWTEIPFFNNKIVCDLIEGKRPPGIFLLLDDVCNTQHAVSDGSDRALVDKVSQVHSGHEHFMPLTGGFTIKHFAGNVNYSAADFQSKNSDLLSNDVMLAIQTSSNPYIQELFPDVVDVENRKKPPTAGSKIIVQCAKLVSQLMDSNPHYVRCIKSTDTKQPNTFDRERCIHQIKYLNLLESIRVRRAGYAYRNEFFRFVNRFRLLSTVTWPNEHTCSDRQACEAIVSSIQSRMSVPAGEIQLGKTKIFIKSPETLEEIDKVKEAKVNEFVCRIQRAWLKYSQSKSQVKARQVMSRMLSDNHKERRRESFFRPFENLYFDREEATKEGIQRILQKYEGKAKGKDVSTVRMLFAEPSERVKILSSEVKKKLKETKKYYSEWLVLTAEAAYIIEDLRKQPKMKKMKKKFEEDKKKNKKIEKYNKKLLEMAAKTPGLVVLPPAQPGQPQQSPQDLQQMQMYPQGQMMPQQQQGVSMAMNGTPAAGMSQTMSPTPGSPPMNGNVNASSPPMPNNQFALQALSPATVVTMANGAPALVQYVRQVHQTKTTPPPLTQLAAPPKSTDPTRSGRWIRKFDPKYKAFYYVDSINGTSQWTIPPDWVEPLFYKMTMQQQQQQMQNGQPAMPMNGQAAPQASGQMAMGMAQQYGYPQQSAGPQLQLQQLLIPKKPPPPFQLLRRIPLSSLESVSLSLLADPFIIFHCNTNVPSRKVKFKESSTCHICGDKFKSKSNPKTKHSCRACGKSVCAFCSTGECILPDFAKALKKAGIKDPEKTPVRVCDDCNGIESCEKPSDHIFKSQRKTELLSILYSASPSLSVNFSNSLTADLKKGKTITIEFRRTGDSNVSEEVVEISSKSNSISVECPHGIGSDFVAILQANAAKRREAAARRREAEMAIRRQREAERAVEREAERKERLKAKKARKAAQKQEVLEANQANGIGMAMAKPRIVEPSPSPSPSSPVNVNPLANFKFKAPNSALPPLPILPPSEDSPSADDGIVYGSNMPPPPPPL